MNQATLQALIDLLRQEEVVYCELREVLEEEHEALTAMAPERVVPLVARKETLALRVKALDQSRRALARKLALELGLAAEHVTVTRLAEAAIEPQAGPLRRQAAALREAVATCQQLNERNAIAARTGQKLVGGLIEQLVVTADPAGQVYQAPRSGAPRGATAGAYGVAGRGRASGLISRRA